MAGRIRKVVAVTMMGIMLVSSGCGKKKNGNKLEGSGYRSPEEAATAFCEALGKQDVQKMISTFAIETFCDNYSAKTNMRRLTVVMPQHFYTDYYVLGGSDDAFINELNYERRRASVSNWIYNMRMSIISATHKNEVLQKVNEGMTYSVMQESDAKKLDGLMDTVFDPEWDIEVGECVDSEYYLKDVDSYKQYDLILSWSSPLNADGYKPMAVSLTINGKDALLFLDAVKYGDRWYIAYIQGYAANFFGLPQNATGLCFESQDLNVDEWIDEANEHGEEARRNIADIEKEWNKDHEAFMDEYDLEDMSEEELEKKYGNGKFVDDPRYKALKMTFDEMLEYLDIDLD
ncbi:MAG: hypothetical protein K6E26_01165 [Clostridiales bacterium]|nr:hypothetical protein [Clostridiales bacterium]